MKSILLIFCFISIMEKGLAFEQLPSRSSELLKKLASIRSRVNAVEKSLLSEQNSTRSTRSQMKRIQQLLKLQTMEKELGKKRLQDLEHTVSELEERRALIGSRMKTQQDQIRKFLIAMESSDRRSFLGMEKLEAPRRKLLANLSDRGLKEIEMLRADLVDAAQLEIRIQEEKQQLTYVFQDLKEQESVLELNRQLQLDFLKKRQNDRLNQLKSYRKLKTAEAQVENLIQAFNARKELENSLEAEKKATQAMQRGEFSALKGKLPFPVFGGRIVSPFGRVFDRKTGLNIFKKGIEIAVRKSQPVKAISAGRIAYAGELSHYGQVVIIDHGGHFYSLCAHLGGISRKANEMVVAGDSVGITADLNTPLYFEIRSRNVAVNPLQWVFN